MSLFSALSTMMKFCDVVRKSADWRVWRQNSKPQNVGIQFWREIEKKNYLEWMKMTKMN